MKILVFRLGGIGDVIMTTPLLPAIKRKYPDSTITYMVGRWSADVVKNNPYIDELKIVDESAFHKKNIRRLRGIIKELKQENFDMALALDKSWMFNLFLFLSKSKKRYGFSREHHFLNKLFSHGTVPFAGIRKEYEYYTSLGKLIDCEYRTSDIKLYPTLTEITSVNKRMGGAFHSFIGIAPGGAKNPGQIGIIKRWPIANYQKLAKQLANSGQKIVVIGGYDDIKVNRGFDEIPNVMNLTGKLNLREVYHLIGLYCKTFITHDSGPLYLAAAANIEKLIALFGPTPAERFAPQKAIVLSSTSHPPSYTPEGNFENDEGGMESITVEDVMKYLK